MTTATHHYAPTLDEVQQLAAKADRTANLVAICSESDAGDETPTTAFLKIRRRRSNGSEATTNKEKDDNLAFIFELSEKNNPIVLRHSIVSAEPWKVMRTGPGQEHHGDPLVHLERELAHHKVTSPLHRTRTRTTAHTPPHAHAHTHHRTRTTAHGQV